MVIARRTVNLRMYCVVFVTSGFHCNCESVSSDKLKLISNNPEDYIYVSCRSEDGKFDFLMGMERLKQVGEYECIIEIKAVKVEDC